MIRLLLEFSSVLALVAGLIGTGKLDFGKSGAEASAVFSTTELRVPWSEDAEDRPDIRETASSAAQVDVALVIRFEVGIDVEEWLAATDRAPGLRFELFDRRTATTLWSVDRSALDVRGSRHREDGDLLILAEGRLAVEGGRRYDLELRAPGIDRELGDLRPALIIGSVHETAERRIAGKSDVAPIVLVLGVIATGLLAFMRLARVLVPWKDALPPDPALAA